MPLYPHQRDMLRFALRRKAWAFYVEQRLGKTLPTIRALRYHSPRAPWLIVAPYSALRSWERALAGEGVAWKWPQGTLVERAQSLEGWAEGHAVLVNWQSVEPLLSALQSVPWGAVVVDESRLMANPTAQVTRALLQLAQDVPVRVLLSGAPATEGPQEYYTQMRFLGEAWGGASFWHWRQRWFAPSPERPQEWTCTAKGERYIADTVKRYAFALRRKDTSYALPATVQEEWVAYEDLPGVVQRRYEQAEREFVWRDKDDVELTSYVGKSRIWLRSCCSGVTIGAVEQVVPWLHGKRITRLRELLRGEYAEEPLVVWCEHVAEVEAVREAIEDTGRDAVAIYGEVPPVERARLITRWSESTNAILVAQSASLARGEDLSAARTVVWWSLPYSLDVFLQAQERTRRIGVHDSTHSIVMLQAGTIEEELWAALQSKDAEACRWWRVLEAARKRVAR